MNTLLDGVSAYSILRGVHQPLTLCERAKALGYERIALIDANGLYGLPACLRYGQECGLGVIPGVELFLPEGRVVLYGRGESGYTELCQIVSAFHHDQSVVACIKACEDIVVCCDSEVFLRELYESVECYYRITDLKRVPRWAKALGLRAMVLPGSAFISPSAINVHRLLRAIDNKTVLSRLDEAELYSPMARVESWAKRGERYSAFGDALQTTVEVAASLSPLNAQRGIVFPDYHQTQEAMGILRGKVEAGLRRRYDVIDGVVVARLEKEMRLIEAKGFADYFLIVDDIVQQSPRTCGRGSGAASLVSYALGITNVDPIRHNLMFERFLNEGRLDPPDIDIDFAWDERDDVLRYVFEHYGDEHTAMVCTHLCFKRKLALRETARVFGLSEGHISKPHDGAPWPAIRAYADRIVGLPRALGTHPGGVVITPDAIARHAPIQMAPKGFPVVQWEKDGAEDMGLVKIDLLGNRSLAVIRDAIHNLRDDGIVLDEFRLSPIDDEVTQTMFARGGAMGCFYAESPASRLLAEKVGQGDFAHMVINTSIIRPAAARFTDDYIRRSHGEAYEPLHETVADVLEETYGVMVYQEQVSQVAMAMADFSAAEADQLRKIIAKKDPGRKLQEFYEQFCRGAQANGVGEQVITDVWDMIMSFAGYSFCKPHSASYCQVTFQAGYLKAHYPAHFMAAVLSNHGGFYSTQGYISESQRLGITILPPDINDSVARYRAHGTTMRVGLSQIATLSADALQRILDERDANGPYHDVRDVLRRTQIGLADARTMALAGALDSMSSDNRPSLLWDIYAYFESEDSLETEHNEPEAKSDTKSIAQPQLESYTQERLYTLEYEALGYLTEIHPLTLVRGAEFDLRIKTIRDQADTYMGERLTLCLWSVMSRSVSTLHGDEMGFITFEDETGLIDMVIFPEPYAQYKHLILRHRALIVTGTVVDQYGVMQMEIEQLALVRHVLREPAPVPAPLSLNVA